MAKTEPWAAPPSLPLGSRAEEPEEPAGRSLALLSNWKLTKHGYK